MYLYKYDPYNIAILIIFEERSALAFQDSIKHMFFNFENINISNDNNNPLISASSGN